MPRPKIAHLTTIDLSLRFLMLDQMRAIQRAGYEVVGISSPGPEVPVVEAGGIRHIAVPMSRRPSPISDLRALLRLVRVFRRERFDVVHTHTPKASLLGQYAALLARVPVRMHTIHGLYLPLDPKAKTRPLGVWLERITMWPSHLNLSQNAEDVPTAIEESICRADRIELLGNGIDLTNFRPENYSAESRADLRRSLGLGPQHKVVGIVARFAAQKGYLDLMDAVPLVREAVPDVRFLFIGDVDHERKDALQPSELATRGIDDVVHFLGRRADIPQLLSIMDVFTLPSFREGLPRAAMEAAAMGVPAVVTNIRGCRQTVDEGVNGHIVPTKSPRELAAAIIDLLRDDEKRRRFSEAARRKAAAEFDQDVVFSRVIAAYNRLLSGRKVDG